MNSAHTSPASVVTLRFSEQTVSLVSERDHDMCPEQRLAFRAWALVCPTAWGRKSWRERVSALLHPVDLETAGVTISEVSDAIEFFTGTRPSVRSAPFGSEPGVDVYVVSAVGYANGPAR